MSCDMKTVAILVCAALVGRVRAAGNGEFWFINDFHYDPTYWTTQESCNRHLSSGELGKYGSYECDANLELVEASVKAMRDELPGPDFIIWAGDNPPHAKNTSYLNLERVMEINKNCTELFKKHFPTTPFYVTMGNHDYYPTHQLPVDGSPVYDRMSEMWTDWLRNDTQAMADFRKMAHYTLEVTPGLRMIVVNTNIYYHKDNHTNTLADPGGQFQWLENLLTTARQNGEKVFILTHIPPGMMGSSPGVHWFTAPHNVRFNEIIRNFGDVIRGAFSTHEHTDSFRVFYKEGKPAASMLIMPSVTPWKARIGDGIVAPGRNPAVRKFIYNTNTFQLVDFEQYYLQLPEANAESGAAQWQSLYRARATYNLQNLSAEAMHNLVGRFDVFASEDFHRYHLYNTVNMPGNPPCSATCKQAHICAIKHVDFTDYNACRQQPISLGVPVHSNVAAALTVVIATLFTF